MKKIALTSLLAVFAVSGAHAANVIDGNPLYMPGARHFYSVTTLGSHSENTETVGLNEVFGYGITNKLAVNVSTTAMDERSFDQWGWHEMSFGVAFRAMDLTNVKLDVLGAYEVDPVWGNHEPFLDKDYTSYAWTAGVRAGYTNARFTVAGKALFEYSNAESFNWTDKGMHKLILGLDGQFVINNSLNAVAGVEYTGVLNDKWAWDDVEGLETKNEGMWHAELGLNYNIDATKFVGVYVSGDMNHHGGTTADKWEVEDGFGFGAKFGIDF